jgi:beta-phosphoglucomutase family hydrolase
MIDLSSRAFIFDMDGTLVDNMAFHTRAWQAMLAEQGVEMDGDEFLVKTAGKTNREILPNVFDGITDEKITELGERKEALYREFFLESRETVKGVTEFLERSRKLGIKMAVATAAPNANVEFILDGLDIRKYFQAVTTAADIANGKPDPEIFLASADKLGVRAENCIVFEDAINGFEAAKRAKMVAIGITTVNSAEELLKLDSVSEAHADFSDLDPAVLIERYLPKTAKAQSED